MVIYFIIPIAVAIGISLFVKLIHRESVLKESKMIEDDFIMVESKIGVVVIFISTFVLFSIVILLNIFSEVEWYINLITIPIGCVFAIGCAGSIREKIIVKKEKIKVIPYFGKSKNYSFENITSILVTSYSNGSVIYKILINKKKYSHYRILKLEYHYLLSWLRKKI